MKELLIILTVCFAVVDGHTQRLRFDQMSVSDGLSSNSVYTIFQDRRGFIWFGTLDGLNRFDGYEIKVYKHNKKDIESLSGNRITNIFEDRHHDLWLYDEHNSLMHKFHPATQKFEAYYLDRVAGSELEVLDTIFDDREGISLRSILGYQLQYDQISDEFHAVARVSEKPKFEKSLKGNATLIAEFDKFLHKIGSPYSPVSIQVKEILKDSQGRFWIGTRFGGLFTATVNKNQFEFISHFTTDDPAMFIESEDIYDIFEDRSQVVWIGTKNKGVYRYSPYKYKFDFIDHVKVEGHPFNVGTVRAITEDNEGNLWIGTNDMGLLKLKRKGSTAQLYRPIPGSSNTIGHRFIRSLWVDPDGVLMVGHYNGFSIYHPKSNTFSPHAIETGGLAEARVYDLKPGRNKNVWMAAWDVIACYNLTTKEIKCISSKDPKTPGFLSENIRELLLDSGGDLWMAAGEKGMTIYDKETGRFITYRSDPNDPTSLPSNNIFHLHKDHKNRIWLGTADGLSCFDVAGEKFTTYTTNDGLPGNLIYGILEDKSGNLWLSTTSGISRFDPEKKQFRNYDQRDGLQSNEFTENAFFQNANGEMFFGGVNGLNIFHPEEVPDNEVAPSIVITNMKVFEKNLAEVNLFSEDMLSRKLRNKEVIHLSPNQRSIRIEFVGLHYVNPQKNRYAYRLEGFDQTWNYSDAQVRFANYTNLEPGEYTFKVKAANSDGVWGDEIIATRIAIASPFYKTIWFRAFSILLIGGLGVLGYRKRISDIKKRQSLKAIQLESELNFLKSQVNPHFLFNTLNNIYALCQVNSSKAAPMVGKISEMMRYMLYDCNGDLVLLRKEIEYLRNYIDLVHLKNPRKLNVEFNVVGALNNQKIAPLLLINFIENSFKHGDVHRSSSGFVKIKIEIHELNMVFSLSNSFPEKHPEDLAQNGIGLENTKQRLKLLYKDRHHLRIEKNKGIFEVELKLVLE
ncbi:MAG TPA: two-component regulator propeller domain-containing protein [Cyclobacteriaceae bacterium]|nr:two-component regulator propeller domain-containing protein [Cyclobacteriaceae bacterium]